MCTDSFIHIHLTVRLTDNKFIQTENINNGVMRYKMERYKNRIENFSCHLY